MKKILLTLFLIMSNVLSAAVIAPEIKKQYFDSNGDPLSAGKLYIYEAGTTTTVTTYTTESAVTANANPIILDSEGRVGGLFLTADEYKFVLKDSDDATIWTQDNVTVRDFGAEIDAIESSVTDINTQISTGSTPNRLTSGKKSSNSSAPRFLVPIGTSNQVKILGATTNLVYVIENTQGTLSTDKTYSGLVTAPTTNNTALINDASLSDQNYTKNLGEFDSVIPYDTAGSEITSKDGDLAAFKIAGTATGYFIARIDNTNSVLREAKRGYFFDLDGNAIERVGFSNNDTLTLMKLTWLYLVNDESMLASYTEPTYSTTEPGSPADGDMWFDITNSKWKRFNSTAFVDAEAVFVGVCIQDESGNTVGARGDYFYGDFSDTNTFEVEYVDAASVRSVKRNNSINVYGTKLDFNSTVTWSVVDNIEDGETEAASHDYFSYIKENGDVIVSPHAPLDLRGRLNGLYHPYETWRYVGRQYNNASSNFDSSSVRNSPEARNSQNLKGVYSTTATYSASRSDEIILCDANSAALTINLFPASIAPGKVLEIKKTDSSANVVTIEPYSSETVNGSSNTTISMQNEGVKIVSDGSNWVLLNRSGARKKWTSYTPTISGAGTPSNVEFFYRRDGGTLKIKGYFTAGTVDAGTFTLTLPSGLDIDSGETMTATRNPVGYAHRLNTAVSPWESGSTIAIFAWPANSTTVLYAEQGTFASTTAYTPTATNAWIASSDGVSIYAEVPCADWED